MLTRLNEQKELLKYVLCFKYDKKKKEPLQPGAPIFIQRFLNTVSMCSHSLTFNYQTNILQNCVNST